MLERVFFLALMLMAGERGSYLHGYPNFSLTCPHVQKLFHFLFFFWYNKLFIDSNPFWLPRGMSNGGRPSSCKQCPRIIMHQMLVVATLNFNCIIMMAFFFSKKKNS